MKAPKILAVASAVDLDFRYGCTPAWWQLWKGMHEVGVDLLVTPYRGKAVESPWWRTASNPLYREAESFARIRDLIARAKGDAYLRRAEESPEDTTADKVVREVIWRYVTPRWQRHLERILQRGLQRLLEVAVVADDREAAAGAQDAVQLGQRAIVLEPVKRRGGRHSVDARVA